LEIGRRYGEAAAAEIAAAIAFYDDELHLGLKGSAGRLGAHMDAARSALPHLVDEMRGLAEGAGRDFEEIAALNCLEEIEAFEACTTIASGRFLMHAEQWYGGHSGVAVVVAEPEGEPAFVSPTCAGFLSVVGMNANGVAQGVDSLSGRDDQIGIPRLLVSRHVLGSRDLTAATDAATIEPRAGGYAYVVAARNEVLTIETTATTSDVIQGVRIHTNHCLSEETSAVAHPASKGSLARFLRAGELVEDPPRSVHDCFALLADHDGEPQSICNHAGSPTGSSTVFGMVCDLHDARVYVSDGPPCEGRWESFDVPGRELSEMTRVG
jgi:isopenicillin-N N-acyltransferase-like protein